MAKVYIGPTDATSKPYKGQVAFPSHKLALDYYAQQTDRAVKISDDGGNLIMLELERNVWAGWIILEQTRLILHV